ncbi:MAG: type II secretion system GspH family protein, partial [Holosporales bacterium]|nr:type II secretion system GspH family protein [Holosporales bacterium]
MKNRGYINGFSLIETAISLLIIGIVSSICMTQLALFTTIDRTRRTQEHCNIIINALGAYFIATDGRLPDPTEKTVNEFGSVPFKELGIMEKFSKDGNGKNILYRVNPYIGIQITNLQHIKLGIEEFTVPYADKIAF